MHQKLTWPLFTFHKINAHLQKHRGRKSNKLVFPIHLLGERQCQTAPLKVAIMMLFCQQKRILLHFALRTNWLVTEAGSAIAMRLNLSKRCADRCHRSFPIAPIYTFLHLQERGKGGRRIGSSFLGFGWLPFGCISYGSRQQSPKA